MSDICGFTDIQNIVESAEWLISDFIPEKSEKIKFSKVRRCAYFDVSLLETINIICPKMEGPFPNSKLYCFRKFVFFGFLGNKV